MLKKALRQSLTKRFQEQQLLIVPKEQVENIDGAFEGDECHFELFGKPVRNKPTQKELIKRALDKRFQYSISNIRYDLNSIEDKKFKKARENGAKESKSLLYNARETELYYKKERARRVDKKFSVDTPIHQILEALVDQKNPKGLDRGRVKTFVEKALKIA